MTTTPTADTLTGRFLADWRTTLHQPETVQILEHLWDAAIDTGDETEKTQAARLLDIRDRVLNSEPVRARDLDRLLAALANPHSRHPA